MAENEKVGELEVTNPPAISPKPGWQTSEGQITALVTAVLTILTGLGVFHITQDQATSVIQLIHDLFAVLVPIAGVVTLLWSYIGSRGRQKSNAINATAAVQVASLGSFSGATLGGFHVGGLLGGKNWKDPKRYLDIAHIAGEFLPGPVGKVVDTVTEHNDPTEMDMIFAAIKALDQRSSKNSATIAQMKGETPQ
jgi:hypothetical protein